MEACRELPYRPPLHWPALMRFLGMRAIPGVEAVEGDCYRRSFRLNGLSGVVQVRPAPDRDCLLARIEPAEAATSPEIEPRLRHLFDLDADPATIGSHLGHDPQLAPHVDALPGLRVPGAWDPFELSVRAILGQQVTVAAATRLAGWLAAIHGQPLEMEDHAAVPPDLHRVFPCPQDLATADLSDFRGPRRRANAIVSLAAVLAENPQLFASLTDHEDATERLSRLPGIGPWTAQYIAMRALHAPDAFLPTDIGLRRAMESGRGRPTAAELLRLAEGWRPWRAYAAMYLWCADTPAPGASFRRSEAVHRSRKG